MISSVKTAHVRKARDDGNTKYVNFDLEDLAGNVRCIMWPREYAAGGELVEQDAVLVARAVVDKRAGGDEVNLIVNELIPFEGLEARCTRGVLIRVSEATDGPDIMKRLNEVLRAYPGTCPLELMVELNDGRQVAMSAPKHRVEIRAELRQRIEELLGNGKFRLLTEQLKTKAPPPRRQWSKN